jgi:hypothetical protein
MTIELIEIAVRDRQAHPKLAGRVTGHVRAVLAENGPGREQVHDLSIPVWTDVSAGASEADIDMALMLKAAGIIARLKAHLAAAS